MESISIKDFTDKNWQQFFELSQEIDRKYFLENYKPELTWEECKNNNLKHLEAYKTALYDEYLLLENGSPVAWVDYALDSVASGFGFNSLYDEIPDYILKAVLNKVYEFMRSKNINATFHWTFHNRSFSAL
jgi:hypothetical protein